MESRIHYLHSTFKDLFIECPSWTQNTYNIYITSSTLSIVVECIEVINTIQWDKINKSPIMFAQSYIKFIMLVRATLECSLQLCRSNCKKYLFNGLLFLSKLDLKVSLLPEFNLVTRVNLNIKNLATFLSHNLKRNTSPSTGLSS